MATIHTHPEFRLFLNEELRPLVVHLQFIIESLDSLVGLPAARTSAKELLQTLKYTVTGEDLLSWNDLATSDRLHFVIDANWTFQSECMRWRREINETVARLYPQCELVVRTGGESLIEWQRRWSEFGGTLFRGRLIATLDDPIWVRFSPYGLPHGPFDFCGETARRFVSYSDCIDLGISPTDVRIPSTTGQRYGLLFFDCLPPAVSEFHWRRIERWFTRGNRELDAVSGGWWVSDIATHWLLEGLDLFSKEKALMTPESGERIIECINRAFAFGIGECRWDAAKGYRCTAEVLELLGDTTRAIEYFEAALESDPSVGVKRKLNLLRKMAIPFQGEQDSNS